MRFRLLPALLTLSALAGVVLIQAGSATAASTDERSTGNLQTTTATAASADERSTGNLQTTVAPAEPLPPIRVEFPAGAERKLVEGKVRKGTPAVVLWAAPQDRMLSAEIVGQGVPISLSVYQPGAEKADGGTSPEDGAIRWIGACGKPGDLRFEIHSRADTEQTFRLGLTVSAAMAQP